MNEFKASKPDIRILIIQTIAVMILTSTLHTTYALYALFDVCDIAVLIFCGMKVFFKELFTFSVVNAVIYFLAYVHIPVLSDIFPPFLIMLSKIYPAYLTLKIMAARAQMNEMLYAFDRMNIPKSFSIPLMVVYRYLPTILQEFKRIDESLKMRNLGFSFRNMKHPIRTVGNYIVPILARSEKISEELSAASLCKGLNTERDRTSLTDVRISAQDIIYLVIMLLAAAGILIFDGMMRGGRI